MGYMAEMQFYDVYVNGEYRSSVGGEEAAGYVRDEYANKPQYTLQILPKGVTPQDLARKLQGVQTMQPKSVPAQTTPAAKKTAKTKTV